MGLAALRADAMPPFAQAYGVDCNTCHTMVPALNSYGRYIQRTGFAALDSHMPFLFFNAEASFGGSSSATFGRPTWQWGLRWAGPLGSPLTQIR
ncbi:MAG TPA: hypothetical protein VFW34_09505 [Candidatus Rubrimentiphilum sp.]|nr:hypothetical protein [Candidatus Rubrimentiphilum sp.]